MIYSAWMTYNWVKAKGNFIEAEQRANATTVALQSEIKNRQAEKESYETRLKAKQGSIIALRKYILEKVGSDNMVDVVVGLHEAVDPTDRK